MSKKKEQHEDHVSEGWLIPYADLLTLLLALFIVLFASSQVDASKFSAMQEAFYSIFQGTGSYGVVGGSGSGTGSGSGSAGDGSGETAYTWTFSTETNNTASSETNVAASTEFDPDGSGYPIDAKLAELQDKFKQYINDHQLQDKLRAELTDQTVMITISDVVLFDSGSAEIKAGFYSTIEEIGNILAAQSNLEIQILGHTDNIPIYNSRFATNWELSSARAISFMKIMLRDDRLNPANCAAIGYGEYRPADTNDTDAGRARNRRVEVTARFSK